MKLADCITRFHLAPHSRLDSEQHAIHKRVQWANNSNRLKQSAVLVALVEGELGAELIFTKRALHMRHHPGQICFPGGTVEKQDGSLSETALRETHEELGLSAEHFTVLGALPVHHTFSGFSIHPILAVAEPKLPFNINKQEVAAVFTVPLHHLMQQSRWHIHVATLRHRSVQLPIYPHPTGLIWGATAAILNNLMRQIAF